MAENDRNTGRALVQYEGSSLESINPRTVMIPESNQERKRFFISGEIVIDQYGIMGFVIGDSRPEKRWVSYNDGDWIGVPYREDIDPAMNSFSHRSHCLDTDKGFKMIRYFLLPPNIQEFFDKDKFLGDPLIEKCCREGTIPEEFDEERARSSWAFGSNALSDGVEEIIDSIVGTANPQLSREEILKYKWRGAYTFVSFHEWQDYEDVLGEGQRSVYASIRNLETVIERFDTQGTLPKRIQISEFPDIDRPQLQAGN